MEFDLHMHSRHSFDSDMKVEQIVRIARSRGLRGIAITDHENADGGVEGLQHETSDFMVIPGFEKFTLSGDLIGLFCTWCPESEDPMDVVKAIREQDGIVYLPHPFIKGHNVSRELAQNLDCVEGFNARHASIREVTNNMGEEKAVRFAEEFGLTLTGGSDAHFYPEIGRGRTTIAADSKDEVREALLSGRTVVSGKRSSSIFMFRSGLRAFPKKFARRLFPPIPVVPPEGEE